MKTCVRSCPALDHTVHIASGNAFATHRPTCTPDQARVSTQAVHSQVFHACRTFRSRRKSLITRIVCDGFRARSHRRVGHRRAPTCSNPILVSPCHWPSHHRKCCGTSQDKLSPVNVDCPALLFPVAYTDVNTLNFRCECAIDVQLSGFSGKTTYIYYGLENFYQVWIVSDVPFCSHFTETVALAEPPSLRQIEVRPPAPRSTVGRRLYVRTAPQQRQPELLAMRVDCE